MPLSYCYRKLAEKWLGSTVAGFQSIDMEVGQVLESEAIPMLEIVRGVNIDRVGLVLTDDESFGASPDGIIEGKQGVEIKCCRPDTHVKYLLGGTVPEEHLLQVHGGMHATGFSSWIFMSYCRRLPPLIVVVWRDEEIQEKIAEALSDFNDVFKSNWERLLEINGGPPHRSTFQSQPQPGFVPTETDVPT